MVIINCDTLEFMWDNYVDWGNEHNRQSLLTMDKLSKYMNPHTLLNKTCHFHLNAN